MASNKKNIKQKALIPEVSYFDRIEHWFESNKQLILLISCVACVLFSFLHFNFVISEGGDDSTYVKGGWLFSHKSPKEYYFSYNAPGYPMFLALPIAIFGLNLVVLKLFSVVFFFFSVYFLFKSLSTRVPALIFYPALFISIINPHFQYFASQTYNEAYFMFWQSLFMLAFLKLFDHYKNHEPNIKEKLPQWIALGLTMFMIGLVKNLGVVVVGVIILFFAWQRSWKKMAFTVGAYVVVRGAFEIIKKIVWGDIGQYGGQGDTLKLKDPYNRALGYEDFGGYVGRLFDNTKIYLGQRFWEILGFLKKDAPMSEKSQSVFGFLAFLFILLFVLAIIQIIRSKNKPLFLVAIYTFVFSVTSFIVLQTMWAQMRIIIIYVPLFLIILFSGLYYLLKNSGIGRNIYIAVVMLVFLSSFISSVKYSKESFPARIKNFKGDIFAGYDPDWANFLKMSDWCTNNLPEGVQVASRKASMSFIYGKGRDIFYGVALPPAIDPTTGRSNPDSLLAIFKREKVTHILDAGLRGYTSMHDKMVYPLLVKYPEKMKLIQQIPPPNEPQIMPSFLYEIVY